MIDFFDRLDKYLIHSNLNDNKITIKASLSNGIIGKARKRGSLSQENISKLLLACSDLNANWLFTGDGEMIKEKDNVSKEFTLRTDTKLNQQLIPLYNLEATAGLVQLFESQNSQTPIDTLQIPNLPKCDGAVFVTGDSMYPILKSGDIVAYKQIHDMKSNIFWGEMYLVSLNIEDEEYVSVKYIQKSDEGSNYIKLVSHNPHHQPKDVHFNQVKGIAMVKASVRINSMQ